MMKLIAVLILPTHWQKKKQQQHENHYKNKPVRRHAVKLTIFFIFYQKRAGIYIEW